MQTKKRLSSLCIASFLSLYLIISIDGETDTAQPKKVNVSVYYETLCYHSVKLIHTQLYPTWLELRDYLNITFLPYGKAIHTRDRNGNLNFLCQHGAAECYGNKIQACALHQLGNDTNAAVEYIACFMSYNNVFPFNNECFEQVNKNPRAKGNFENCVNNSDGIAILEKYGDLTLNLNPRFSSVPAIAFNDVFDVKKDMHAHNHFKSVVCDLISDPKPQPCFSMN